MSYILEALRRAESERQRGQVPGLGAGPVPTAPAASAAGGRRWLWLALGSSALLLAAALGWVLQRPATPSPHAREAATGTGPAAVVPASPAIAPAPMPAPAPFTSPAVATSPPPVASALPVVVSAPAEPAAGPPPAQALPTPVPAAAAVPQPVEPAATQRTLKLAELTPQQRSEWPALRVGGSVWSDSAASRFVILDGQVLREGQPVVPGLVLERIQPRSALLRWRGLLVELPL